MKSELEEISMEFVRGLPIECGTMPNTTPWTNALKNQLYKMGKDRGMLPCGRNAKEYGGEGEWMLDVVWWSDEHHEVVLGVESELGNARHVIFDFDKLMSVDCPHKLLLFYDAPNLVKKLELNLATKMRHHIGDDYMLLAMHPEDVRPYYFQVPSEGCLNVVKFIQLETLPWPWKRSCDAAGI